MLHNNGLQPISNFLSTTCGPPRHAIDSDVTSLAKNRSSPNGQQYIGTDVRTSCGRELKQTDVSDRSPTYVYNGLVHKFNGKELFQPEDYKKASGTSRQIRYIGTTIQHDERCSFKTIKTSHTAAPIVGENQSGKID